MIIRIVELLLWLMRAMPQLRGLKREVELS